MLNESEKIKKIETELQRIRDKILNLKIIFVHLESEDDAYMIFETLNTRGKDLTVADLVKNHILRNLKNTNMKVDRYKDKWTGIVKSFEDSEADLSLNSFLHHYWLSKYEYTTEKKLFWHIRKLVKPNNTLEFLNTLSSESNFYRLIHEPTMNIRVRS